jgi:3-oxoacyl-[acyl-carrier-protein] synthase III
MGVRITNTIANFGEDALTEAELINKSVLNLATDALKKVIHTGLSYSHLLAVTSCPDSIAPSLGQGINQQYNSILSNSHTIDIVQGCAGGVTALILASQLSEINKSNVLIVASDAAQKATSKRSEVYKVFKNGVFGCCVSYTETQQRLLHHKSKQYKDLYNTVTIALGHDADTIIADNINDVVIDSRKHLGLKLNNNHALKLMKEAEGFYLDFIAVTGHPDILILHQVNEVIIDHLEKVFSKYPVRFINVAKETGNCGCATTGIVLDMIKNEIEDKKVMICSFGTGGVITAGLWQF